MSLHKWICTQSCYFDGQMYKRGDIVLRNVTPRASFFSTFTGTEPLVPADESRVDMDGTYYYGAKGWEDFKFPLSSTKVGALNKPDYDFTNNGYLFPQNDATEILYASDQFPHSLYVGPGSVGKPHIHLVQAANQQVVFKLKYRIISNNGTIPSFTTLTSTGYGFAYSSGSLAQILLFPDISLEGVGTSSLVDIQLYREDNVYTGDILVKSLDIHIPLDSLGSGQEYLK